MGGTIYLNGIPTQTGAFIIDGSSSVLDDIPLGLGSGSPAKILWETADSNANAFLIQLPTGGATDVPVIVIGQALENVDLALYNDVVNPCIAVFGVGAVTTAPVWEFRKARGTVAAPTVITTGDDLGSINAYACVANGEWVLAAAIVLDSEGTIATTRAQGIIRFRTGTNAAPSVFADRLTIDSDYVTSVVNITAPAVLATYFRGGATISYIESVVSDTASILFKMNDAGVGGVEIARMMAAADPYFQVGRDDTGVALNAVTDMLVLQAGGGTGNEAAGFGFGMKWMLGNAASEVEERGRINLRLVTATNAAEDTGWDIYTQLAGASNLAFKIDQAGELYGDADSSSGAYMTQNVNLFDEYDDVAELRRFQLTVARTGLVSEEQRLQNQERLVELGVWERKPEGSAGSPYLMKMQTMTRLLAGGIWQTRGLIDNLEERVRVLEGVRA